MNVQPILLTQTAKKGGCAAKLPAKQLKSVLQSLHLRQPKELVVGTKTMDDACLWDLGDGKLLVQTVDFFTPIVDDPHEFGAIAATNAISDVYAMGGLPKTALSILCFPGSQLPMELIQPLMEGAIEKIHESGACLAGGHSIDDETLKLGFAVTGFVEKKRAWTNAGAEVGDLLILTKALGTGTISSSIKNKSAKSDWVRSAILSMKQLNNVPEFVSDIPIHAATDITGFGLAGHAMQLALASGVSLRIQTTSLPSLPGAIDCLNANILNRAHKTNSDYVSGVVEYQGVAENLQWLTLDPQTSGGLLLVVSESNARRVTESLGHVFPSVSVIGEVKEKGQAPVLFV